MVRKWNGSVLAGIIIEAEALQGGRDLACQRPRGQDRRNATMYGPPGPCHTP